MDEFDRGICIYFVTGIELCLICSNNLEGLLYVMIVWLYIVVSVVLYICPMPYTHK